MTEYLEIAIEELYTTFSAYPFRSTMEGCPCCVSQGDKEKLHSKKLRELEGKDLSKYARKALTTWGDLNDFKHYLPRIFELLSTTYFAVDAFVIFGKLEYGAWKTWATTEQLTIRNFLLVWWDDTIKNKSYFDSDAFVEIYKLLGNIDELLKRWPVDFSDNSFRNFVEFVYDNYYDLTNKQANFRAFDYFSIEKILKWISDKTDALEKGFFHFEQSDRGFSEKISTVLFMVEKNR